MSISEEITRIGNNISDTYDVAEAAGASTPANRNSNNLAATVAEAITKVANQSYRKLDETLYAEALATGTYNGTAITDGEIFTTYKGTFEQFHNTSGNYTLTVISSATQVIIRRL